MQVVFGGDRSASIVGTPGSSSVRVRVPAGAVTGPITITTPGGSTRSGTFTVLQPPTVSAISRASGRVGDEVVISGSNFTASGMQVVFGGGRSASIVGTPGSSSVRVRVPAGAVTGPITITTPGGSTRSGTFTVLTRSP
jgi:hypothetical protein